MYIAKSNITRYANIKNTATHPIDVNVVLMILQINSEENNNLQ